jgi:hypothetical protein
MAIETVRLRASGAAATDSTVHATIPANRKFKIIAIRWIANIAVAAHATDGITVRPYVIEAGTPAALSAGWSTLSGGDGAVAQFAVKTPTLTATALQKELTNTTATPDLLQLNVTSAGSGKAYDVAMEFDLEEVRP